MPLPLLQPTFSYTLKMIVLKNASLQRGKKRLFAQSNLNLYHGWHLGLIGQNGSGKSSLFSLFLGQLTLDQGDFSLPKHYRIAHMAQEVTALDRTALDYAIDGDEEYRHLEKSIALAEEASDHNLIASLHEQFDTIDGYSAPSRAAKLLNGLGFEPEQHELSVSSFSGGWRVRLSLAKTLMCRSDLLLLDEPTNHLDLDAIIWLENWLKQYPGTLVLISHDREFLDGAVQHTVHIDQQRLNYYKGNYSQFEGQLAARLAQHHAEYEKQQREIAHMHKFIERFRAKATKAKQAQSRIKALDRLEKIAPAHVNSPFQFHFEPADKISDPLIKLDNINAGYASDVIVSNVNLHLRPDSQIGLLGPNGAGKSTLLKTLVGELPIISGERWQGEHCQIGYFCQHTLEQLDENASPMVHLQRISPDATEQILRNFLGGFAFHGDIVFEPITPFSGGEKARLALALIVWRRPNLLVLDEPTNNLDLEMRHALTVALQEFKGALIVVTHDRNLLRNTTNELMVVANGEVAPFDGDLDEYATWLTDFRSRKGNEQSSSNESQGTNQPRDKKEERRLAAQKRKQLNPLRAQLRKLEKELLKLQQYKTKLEQQMTDPDLYQEKNKDKLASLIEENADISKKLETTETHWLAISEELEQLEKELK